MECMGPVVFPVSFATTLGPRYQYLLHTHILQICGPDPLLKLHKDLGIEPSNPPEKKKRLTREIWEEILKNWFMRLG